MDEPAADLKSIFSQALEISEPEERGRFLDRACAGRPGLRDEVGRLLRAWADAGSFLETVTAVPSTAEGNAPDEEVGKAVGPYTILDRLGEGGMGVVYAADQVHPLRRTVALKLIKAGMGSRQVLDRFEVERQALALMDHPNIAKVFDAGTSSEGRPYFVMELIRGVPITEYCDRAGLTLRERLALLVPVCRAVQHAHQKGVIHRDIKPSNVLVSLHDGRPVPKVIDFGVAKAVDRPPGEGAESTRPGVIVGTLEYMSPEQAENGPGGVDTRADVYALGVILYELMIGSTPMEKHRVRQVGHFEVIRWIREDQTPRPFERLSRAGQVEAIAARRGTGPLKLARLVRGELEWIAMKALEKERARRYATANDLADDIRRYLDGEPIEAGPPSSTYRLRKFAAKHVAALVTAAMFAAVLVAAAGFAARQAVRATREAEKARLSDLQARAALGFLQDRVLAAARPLGQEGGRGHDVTLLAALDAAEPAIAGDFAAQPLLEASIRETFGTTYLYLVEPARAIRQHLRAMTLREQVLGPDHADTLASLNNLAVAYQQAGRYVEAITLHERDLRHSKATLGPNHLDTIKSMNNLAAAYRKSGRTADAIGLLEGVLKARTALLGPGHKDTLNATNNLAVALRQAGRYPEALQLLEGSLGRARSVQGPAHPDTLKHMTNLAGVYSDLGRSDDAVKLHGEAFELRRKLLGPANADTLTSMNNLAVALQSARRPIEALPLLEQVAEIRAGKLGPDHPDTLISWNNLAVARQSAGRLEEARGLFERVLQGRQRALPPGDPDILRSMNSLGVSYSLSRQWGKAEAVLRQCMELREPSKPDDWRRFQTRSLLGAALVGLGRYAEAEPLLTSGFEGLVNDEPASRSKTKDVADAGSRLVSLYEAWGLGEEAGLWRSKLQPKGPRPPISNGR